MSDNILVESDGNVGIITISRPEKLNSMTPEMANALVAAVNAFNTDDQVRCVILTGAGEKAFCAGSDIRALDDYETPWAFRNRPDYCDAIRALLKPSVAAVNGYAFGGGLETAMTCDIRIASDRATFGPTFARIGLHPDWGGSWFIPRLVGPAKACELVFTGDMVSAQEAEKIGLVNRVTPHDDLMPALLVLASRTTRNPPGVIRLAKESIYRSLSSDLDGAFVREDAVQLECFRSADFLEGVTAFMEKRPPHFRGV